MTWLANIPITPYSHTLASVYQGTWNQVVMYAPVAGMGINFPLQKSLGVDLHNDGASFAVKNATQDVIEVVLALDAAEIAGGCEYENPYTHQFDSTDTPLVVPACAFEWGYSAQYNTWFLIRAIYPTPKRKEQALSANVGVGGTWTSILTDTVDNYGLHSFIYNAEYEWIAPGGNPTLDFSSRLEVNGVTVKTFDHFEADKPSSRNISIAFPIWATDLSPGDVITVDAINSADGTLNALGDAGQTFMQITGPFF